VVVVLLVVFSIVVVSAAVIIVVAVAISVAAAAAMHIWHITSLQCLLNNNYIKICLLWVCVCVLFA